MSLYYHPYGKGLHHVMIGRNQRIVRSTIRTAALELLQQSEQTHPVLITEADLLKLPEAIQQYLRYTRVVGRELACETLVSRYPG
jgi:hypothetical protein